MVSSPNGCGLRWRLTSSSWRLTADPVRKVLLCDLRCIEESACVFCSHTPRCSFHWTTLQHTLAAPQLDSATAVFAQYVVCCTAHAFPVYLKCHDHLIHLPKCILHKVHCIPQCVQFDLTFPVWWINRSDYRIITIYYYWNLIGLTKGNFTWLN